MAKAAALNKEAYHLKASEESVNVKKALLNKEWFTASDVAEIFGISKKRVYQMILDGQLDVVKISERRTRISKAELMLFIAKRAGEPIKSNYTPLTTSEADTVLARDNCYSVKDIMEIFQKNRGDTYVFLKRSGVSKIKIKKEVFFSKSDVNRLFRKFVKPRQVGHDKEWAVNKKLASKGVNVEDCYSMRQCEDLLGMKRENLYNKFSRRNVPKVG